MARKINRGVMIAGVVVLALPAFARANPLLSGYGAPGQGSQALLGSTLAGPRGGGSGGSGGSSGAPAPSIEQAPSAAAATTGESAAGQGGSERHAPAGTRSTSSQSGASGADTGGSAPGSGAAVPPKVALARKSSVHTDAAGLSGGDLALIALAIGVIFATGLLTARIARGGKSVGGGG